MDGLHIRNLMITYFFRFFDQVVQDHHLYVLETPLFRVRNKQEGEHPRDVRVCTSARGTPSPDCASGLA